MLFICLHGCCLMRLWLYFYYRPGFINDITGLLRDTTEMEIYRLAAAGDVTGLLIDTTVFIGGNGGVDIYRLVFIDDMTGLRICSTVFG